MLGRAEIPKPPANKDQSILADPKRCASRVRLLLVCELAQYSNNKTNLAYLEIVGHTQSAGKGYTEMHKIAVLTKSKT